MLKRLLGRFERGQALVEYMPTIAGAMALAALFGIGIGGGVTQTYCKVVDAFGKTPDVCTADDGSSDTNDDTQNPNDDGTCVITLDSADGGYPEGWNTSWTEGEVDTLRVTVANLDEPIQWSLKLRFPTDPDSEDTEVKTGEFPTDGEYTIDLSYPPEGGWGPVSTDGYGIYEAHATLNISNPCDDVGWDRWYKADWSADLAIDITHDVSPVTVSNETLTYTVTVTNNGPNAAEVYDNQGAVVNLPVPAGVTVVSATPSQGECDTQIVCDLGAMPVLSSATITVVTTVPDPVNNCVLTATSDVSAPRPPDPNMLNNEATTIPDCATQPVVCVDDNPLGVATAFNTFTLGDHSSPNGSDTEGRMAVGHNATLGSYSVGFELDASWAGKDVLVVGNDLNYTSGRVYYGDVTVGGTANLGGGATVDGDVSSGMPIDFNAAGTYLKALSSTFADAEVNGTTTKQYSCQIVLDGTDEQLNVFEVSGSDLASMCQLDINIPSGSTAVINVSGSSVTFASGGFFINGQSAPSSHSSSSIDDIARVVYNFPNATSVTIPSGGISGAMLAPNAKVTFNSGVLWGTLVSGSFEGAGQINHVQFQGCVPAMTN